MVVHPRTSSGTLARIRIVRKLFCHPESQQDIAKTAVVRLMDKKQIRNWYGRNADYVLDCILSRSLFANGRIGSLYNSDIVSIVFRRVSGKKTTKGFSVRPVAARLAYAFANNDIKSGRKS